MTFSDLNAEFNNILNNPGSLVTPITFHLTFTDATYDIGASGATRPRDFFLSRNAVIGGTLGVTGATTLSAALTYGGVTLSNAVTGTGNMVLSASQTLTGTLTAAIANFSGAVTGTSASPQLTLGVLNTTSGGILSYGSTSGSQTWKPPAAAGAGVTITFPATTVTLNAAGDLTGTTLAAGVVTSSLTTVGALNSGSITSGFGSIDVGADAISGGAISGTTVTGSGIGNFGGGTKVKYVQAAPAIDTTATLFTAIDYGWLVIFETSQTGKSATFLVNVATGITEISDPSAAYSTTAGTASSANVTIAGSVISIQNKLIANGSFQAMLISL